MTADRPPVSGEPPHTVEASVAIRRVRERIDHAVSVRSITENERVRFLDILYDDTDLNIRDSARATPPSLDAMRVEFESEFDDQWPEWMAEAWDRAAFRLTSKEERET
jgi:hypothetical protein